MFTIIAAGLMLFGTLLSVVGYFLQRKRMKRKNQERNAQSITGIALLLIGFAISIPVGVYYWMTEGI